MITLINMAQPSECRGGHDQLAKQQSFAGLIFLAVILIVPVVLPSNDWTTWYLH
ncbi:MAG: hypothetical protein ABJZ55_25565 [Fuerstiella sp.]